MTKGPKNLKVNFGWDLDATKDWQYGCNFKNTVCLTVRTRSVRPLSACPFILCWAHCKCILIWESLNLLSSNISWRSGTMHCPFTSIPKCTGVWPYSASKGEVPKLVWWHVLYQNSASGSHIDHLFGHETTKIGLKTQVHPFRLVDRLRMVSATHR